MKEESDPQVLERVLGPGMGPWQLLRWASAILVLSSLAGVVTRHLPPAQGRTGGVEGAGGLGLFFLLHAAAWALVFVFATRRARAAGQS